MPKELKVPKEAKDEARKGLKERKDNNAGLTPKEARDLGVYSGVAMANKIISSKFLGEDDLKRIARFHLRFKKCNTPKCKTAKSLWGGSKFGKLLYKIYYS